MVVIHYSSPFVLSENNKGDVFIAIKDLFEIMLMYDVEGKYVLNEVGIQRIKGLECGFIGSYSRNLNKKTRETLYRFNPFQIIVFDEPNDLVVRVHEGREKLYLYLSLRRNLKSNKYILNVID
ncbi:MAG TPA: hypothetical protein VJB89_02705 [Candidatus Nanoarchaeia archaeon]|nr:hypothetical protein [Candidatus Nanoarchaeia archaeon]